MIGYGKVDRSYDLTWEQLVSAEPRLGSLLEEVRMARPDDANEYELEGVWGQFKDKIAGLVGWHRRQGEPLLQTEAAYRTAYKKFKGDGSQFLGPNRLPDSYPL